MIPLVDAVGVIITHRSPQFNCNVMEKIQNNHSFLYFFVLPRADKGARRSCLRWETSRKELNHQSLKAIGKGSSFFCSFFAWNMLTLHLYVTLVCVQEWCAQNDHFHYFFFKFIRFLCVSCIIGPPIPSSWPRTKTNRNMPMRRAQTVTVEIVLQKEQKGRWMGLEPATPWSSPRNVVRQTWTRKRAEWTLLKSNYSEEHVVNSFYNAFPNIHGLRVYRGGAHASEVGCILDLMILQAVFVYVCAVRASVSGVF